MAFDTSNLWRPTKTKIDIFTGGISELDGASLTGWTAWTRPKNATWLSFLCIGGAGGGGPGRSGAAGTIRGGGGGGGSGGLARLIVPAMMLPRTLFLYPGYGGAGGTIGVNAFDGSISVIAMRQGLQFSSGISNALRANCILISGNSYATGGNQGDAAGGGNAGGGQNIATNTTGPLTSLGPWFASEGASGGAGGGSGSPGSNSAAFGGASTGAIPLTGGAGGGSVSAADAATNGGDIPGGGLVPTLLGGVAGAVGADGVQGFFSSQPRLMTGGTGGGGGTTTGGRGGDGSPGCGGGGGGGGITAGVGGNGGPGMIVIVSW